MKKFIAILLALVMVAALGSSAFAETVKIGYVGDLTGSTSIWGQAGLNGCLMAVEDVNAAGGVLDGIMLEMDPQDGKGDAADSVNGFKKAIADGCVASIGTNFSSCNIPMAAVADDLKVVALATAASNDLVTVDENGKLHPYSFRMCFIDSYQGTIAGQYGVMDMGYKTAGLFVVSDNAYSTGIAKYLQEAFTAAGGEVIITVNTTSTDEDFRTQLAKVKKANPDVLYILFSDYAKIAQCAIQARELELTCDLFGTDGWDSRELLTLDNDALVGAKYVSRPGYNTDIAKEFGKRYAEKYNVPESELETESLYGYDCVMWLVDAMTRANSTDPTAIRDALEATETFSGVMGSMIMNAETHNPNYEIAVFTVGADAATFEGIVGLRDHHDLIRD